MSSQLTPECSSCGQRNESAMHFCIFCGQSLRGGAKSTRVSSLLPALDPTANQARQATGAAKVPITCGQCGRTDPLNGVFCVLCGARTAGPAPGPTVSATSDQMALSTPPPRSTDFTHTSMSQSIPRRSQSQVSMPLTLVGCVLGAAIGVGGAFLAGKLGLEETLVQNLWPAQGLVVYTDLPAGEFLLANNKQTGFVVGRTGPGGAAACADLEAGGYKLTLFSKKGEEVNQLVNIQTGKASSVGYPTPINLSAR